MNNIKTKFALFFLAILLCVPVTFIHADDTTTIVVPDITPPVITLLGNTTVSIQQGATYIDAGATANDNIDGDITSKIVVANLVNTAIPGSYTINYTVNDVAGNVAISVIRTVTITLPPPALIETIFVRNGDTIVYQGTINLPSTGTVSITDNQGTVHLVNAKSVLGLLYSISQTSNSFSLSNIQYYSSFGALYLKCLTPTSGTQACDNWQYVVNGIAPSTGMDTFILTGAETINLYFGSPRQVIFNTTSIIAGGSFIATAQKYNYLDNTWISLSGVTIGVTVPNPNDPYNPTIVTSQAVDTNGNATLTLATAGTYTVGISEDYYFPSYAVTVTAPTSTIVVPDTTPPVITLLGNTTVSIQQGATYIDAGATANDNIDGDITSKIVVANLVNTAIPGSYTINYTVNDVAGNVAISVIRTVTITLPPPALIETIFVRNGDTIVYQGTINLPSTGTVSITDNQGTVHLVNAKSVLGLLYSISQTSNSFSLSNIQYYSSFGALYLKCLTPTSGTQACDNWQYVVNGIAPSTGMDTFILTGAETINLYFGSPRQVIFNTTSIIAGGSFIATAQKYNYLDNTWISLSGVTIGVTVPNPNDPYNPTIVTSQAVDTNGNATLTLATAGTYTVGISEDYYFPSYAVTVTAPTSSSGPSSGGSGGMAISFPPFNVPNAIAYLTSVQSSDGSFGASDMYTDWAAIALGAANISGSVKTNLLNYISLHNTVSSLLTDNERRAMALLALEQNPYSFNGTDYIAPIVNSFDGVQFGDPSLHNDDIFALIPLASVGYTANDSIIAKDIAFIVGRQESDGSWNKTPDMTASAIMAIKPFNSVDGVSAALAKATAYLQNAQKSDGCFGSIYSTSWVIQAMSTLGVSWTNNGNGVTNCLATHQTSDGAALALSETLQNRIWATSYSIPAALGKSWNAIMHSVTRPVLQIISSDNGSVIEKISLIPLIILEEIVTPTILSTIAPSPQKTSTTIVVSPKLLASVTPALIPEAIKTENTIQEKTLSDHESKSIEISPHHNLLATAEKSGTDVPIPVAVGLVISSLFLASFAFRFIVKP